MDDDDWDISSLEEDRSIGRKAGREQKEPPPPLKNESNSTQVPNAWVAANPKGPKGEGLQFWCLPEAFINTRLPNGLPWWLSGKESACQAGDVGLTPVSEISPGEGNSNPLQYFCLGNPMDRGAWQASLWGHKNVGHD